MEIEIYKMTYKKEENKPDERVLGEIFVENNMNKGKLIIFNKKTELKSILEVEKIKNSKLKMVLSKDIFNKSCVFKNCESLVSISLLSFEREMQNLESEDFVKNLITSQEKEESSSFDSSDDTDENNLYHRTKAIFSLITKKATNENEVNFVN